MLLLFGSISLILLLATWLVFQTLVNTNQALVLVCEFQQNLSDACISTIQTSENGDYAWSANNVPDGRAF